MCNKKISLFLDEYCLRMLKYSCKSWKGWKSMKNDKFIWTAKVGDKGQIVIPKEARDIFNINSGDNLILFGDRKRGIAIAKYDDYSNFVQQIFDARDNN